MINKVNATWKPSEEIRLRHRYIDLRRRNLQDNLRRRSTIINAARNLLINKGKHELRIYYRLLYYC
jgi:aspartyl-tRNA synthetase